jgi:Fe(3+) dicitrate transport protein
MSHRFLGFRLSAAMSFLGAAAFAQTVAPAPEQEVSPPLPNADVPASPELPEVATNVESLAPVEIEAIAWIEEEAEPIEVVIADTPLRRTAGSAHVISEEQLSRYEYDDAHAVLAQVPGVYVRTEDGMGLRPNIGLRGVNPERSKKVTLLEDGVLFGPAPYSAPAAYFFPVMTRMSAVRVIKGPGAVSHGPQTVGGTIDLISRTIPSARTASVDGAFGQYGYLKGHAYVGGSGEQSGVLIEGVHLENNGFKWLDNASDTGFSRNEWVVKARHVIDPTAETTNTLQLKLSYADEISNESYLGLTRADFDADPNYRYAASNLDQMTNHRTSVVVTHELESLSGLRIKTDAYRHDYERSWRKVNAFRNAPLFDVLTQDSARSEVYRAVLRGEADASSSETLLIGPNHRWYVSQGIQSVGHGNFTTGPIEHRAEVGLRYHYDRIARRHSEDSFLLIGGEPFPDGGPTAVTAFNRAYTHAVSVHAVDALSAGPVTLTPGIRAEIIRSTAEDQLTGEVSHRLLVTPLPGVGAFWDAGRGLGVLAGVYRGFSPPEPGSSSDVKPESSWNYEAGARFTSDFLQAEVIGFLNDYGNLSNVCSFATGCVGEDVERQFNAGEALIYGVESSITYEAQWGDYAVPFAANYTWTHGEFSETFTSADPIFGKVKKGDEMPYLPQHQWRVSAALEHANGGLHVAANYVSAMREVAGREPFAETLASESLFTVDVGGTLSMGQPFSLYANVNNLLDQQRLMSQRPFGARPNAPRWVHAGIKASF